MMASGPLRAEASCLRPLCRNFARGFCRWGQSCRFSHDRKSAQVCRYFQRGFCRYGEQCSYQHMQEEPAPVGTQYGLMPHDHWDQEPGTEPTAMDRDQGGTQRTSAHPACSMTCVASESPKVEVEVEEEDKKNISALGFQPRGPALDLGFSDPREEVLETATWTDPTKVPAEPGAVAALVTTASLRAQSEAIVCGICMDRVYEKPLPEERLFGILPNCSHAYCVGCIRKWRCSRDFQSKVIKACPECRITSSYYIPHKYWISDVDEKEKLIRTFKARTGKIRCKFFIRGHCPFRSECIYLHELPACQLRRPRRQRPRMPAVFIPSSSESSDEEDEFCTLEWALTLAMMETEFPYSSYGHEVLLIDFSDSD
ncbi:PREDICTED: probable E3 ubiquitin-protein ligase makorin-1 [Pseudopodoces humilis]|uniref:probable E3 ubiquitin-protein ligase makorin-1 n=1 Tax=Pseudopodoces humilis TaxID=181119 RepID=UPI0006B81A83|nr:PREDICTED: probable E3 ubiquitin-protein ligase makorin-1 [Pseudopodoces humilis]